jgi:D-arabinitol 4-dehydrogenase
MGDPATRIHFDRREAENVLPGLSTVNVPFDKDAYLDEITARFANAAIADRLERICMDGWSIFLSMSARR